MPELPRLPGIARISRLVGQATAMGSAQAHALADLPRILLDLNKSVLGLIDALGSARDTMARMAEVTARMERVAEELEEPIMALRPGIERLARVLDNDAVDTLPETLRSFNEDVLPLIQGLRDTQNRVNTLAGVLPGASLLFARRPRPSGERAVNGDPPPTIVADTPVTPPDGE